jgi:hypothetical protein
LSGSACRRQAEIGVPPGPISVKGPKLLLLIVQCQSPGRAEKRTPLDRNLREGYYSVRPGVVVITFLRKRLLPTDFVEKLAETGISIKNDD